MSEFSRDDDGSKSPAHTKNSKDLLCSFWLRMLYKKAVSLSLCCMKKDDYCTSLKHQPASIEKKRKR